MQPTVPVGLCSLRSDEAAGIRENRRMAKRRSRKKRLMAKRKRKRKLMAKRRRKRRLMAKRRRRN